MQQSEQIEPEKIQSVAAEVLSRDYYRLEQGPEAAAKLLEYLFELIAWILYPIAWFVSLLNGVSPFIKYPVIIALTISLLLLLYHIIWSIVQMLKKPHPITNLEIEEERRFRSAEEYEALASRSAKDNRFADAVRFLLAATLARLEDLHKRRFRRGTTNREHLRRYRKSPVFEPLRLLVELIDQTWYGNYECTLEHYSQGEKAYQSIRQAIQERMNAHRA